MKLEKDLAMDWFPLSLLALLAPIPILSAGLITAIIVLVMAQALTLLYRWLGRAHRPGSAQAKALAG